MKEAAGVAVFDPRGELLLGRHVHDGRWATLGGGVEEGESPEQAARRELREECGLVVGDLAPIGRFGGGPAYDVTYPDGTVVSYAVTMFGILLDTRPQIEPDLEEILEITWADEGRVDAMALGADMVDIVPAAFAWRNAYVTA